MSKQEVLPAAVGVNSIGQSIAPSCQISNHFFHWDLIAEKHQCPNTNPIIDRVGIYPRLEPDEDPWWWLFGKLPQDSH